MFAFKEVSSFVGQSMPHALLWPRRKPFGSGIAGRSYYFLGLREITSTRRIAAAGVFASQKHRRRGNAVQLSSKYRSIIPAKTGIQCL